MEKAKKNHYFNDEDENALSLYLREINTIELLSREEEDSLARRARAGDEDAKNRLLQANLRFVVNVAKKFQNQGLPLADLISEGNIGMIHAIERFNPDQGFHFISYAVWWIRQAIMKALGEKSRSIRLPQNRANELVQIEKARKIFLATNNKEPTAENIADLVGLEPALIQSLLNTSRGVASLDSPASSETESNSTLGEFITDSRYTSPESELEQSELHQQINKLLATLPAKEAKVLEMRFGLNNHRAQSLKEVGEYFNLTKERIRQIEKKALQRLAKPANKADLAIFVA
ncbi:sigma-70 family RNA polymerase sigma factor [Entomospira culicis]|uniref:RNA polymerase sigma factor RpoD/SigA n=1 Tax=Entomospira culicis TaxID=2719989 RepID=A0A968GHK8_9SPIO|nr:RNA polymerase sigma factor RpoD/SigA [Entomospira culicis]NIZ19762.1 RNA polymerase sigma factor RpoD/SigA [Entomospira culicis]NIZ69976.1 RNA polymerase sigma factor RpoD/SigA [Entomospira culicis]WDI37081.1 RNA polymerase sigma factor RpoD/SigA [Entomospira culicis]WDI38710.1 RNA polymerase sigma factor RpoD/SigA [Entomospira culicis]